MACNIVETVAWKGDATMVPVKIQSSMYFPVYVTNFALQGGKKKTLKLLPLNRKFNIDIIVRHLYFILNFFTLPILIKVFHRVN